ncbi:hypothetical protein [Salmonella enterica]|uniref:hypothetical protein n=1 Tax=Salmonella enterica TaxID=28901 RepID=UPI00398C7CB8
MDRQTSTAQERETDTCAGRDEEVLKDKENSVARKNKPMNIKDKNVLFTKERGGQPAA